MIKMNATIFRTFVVTTIFVWYAQTDLHFVIARRYLLRRWSSEQNKVFQMAKFDDCVKKKKKKNSMSTEIWILNQKIEKIDQTKQKLQWIKFSLISLKWKISWKIAIKSFQPEKELMVKNLLLKHRPNIWTTGTEGRTYECMSIWAHSE